MFVILNDFIAVVAYSTASTPLVPTHFFLLNAILR